MRCVVPEVCPPRESKSLQRRFEKEITQLGDGGGGAERARRLSSVKKEAM